MIDKGIEHIRRILAGGDIGSLPNDYPTVRMAEDRMTSIHRLHRIERDLRNIEETLREQASGLQDIAVLQVADDIRRILA